MTSSIAAPPRIGSGRPDSWTSRLWADIAGIFDAITAHPFITGLTDGTRARRGPRRPQAHPSRSD